MATDKQLDDLYNTAPVPTDADMAELAKALGTEVTDLAKELGDATPVKVTSKDAYAAGRAFARNDYLQVARHLYRLRLQGRDVTARTAAYAKMFAEDSDAHPVDGYPAFDADLWVASFTV